MLLIGVVAEGDGLFAAAGRAMGDLPVGARLLFVSSLGVVAVVTAVLNLDTSVFFLTPILLHLARSRGVSDEPYLYGAVFMSNASSLFLPGSNLTNLIVLHGEHVSGGTFFVRTWAPALAATVATIAVLLILFWRGLGSRGAVLHEPVAPRLGIGALAVALATVLILVLSAPALPVLAVGLAAVLGARTTRARVAEVIDARVLGGLFVLAVALGTLGRHWGGLHSLIASAGRVDTAITGVAAATLVNNLPAAVLLTPAPPVHGRALLIGLNLGPNLAVTGSLSALLWLRAARAFGGRPSAVRYSLYGLVVVPVSVATALGALAL